MGSSQQQHGDQSCQKMRGVVIQLSEKIPIELVDERKGELDKLVKKKERKI